MSTIFDALKKASKERKLHVTKSVTRGLEDRLYQIAGEAHGDAPSSPARHPLLLIGGIVVVLAAIVLVLSLVVTLFQRPEHSRTSVALSDDVQPPARPAVVKPVEPQPPSRPTTEDRQPEPGMLAVADLTAKPATRATPVPQQSVQPPTIIKINLQPAAPAASTSVQAPALSVPAASTPSLPAEPAPAQQVAPHFSPQPASPLPDEPAKESVAPAEVSSAPIREEGKTFGLALEGIVWDKTEPMAMINGKIVEEGDKIEGVRIVKILKTTVEIEKEGKHYSIKY